MKGWGVCPYFQGKGSKNLKGALWSTTCITGAKIALWETAFQRFYMNLVCAVHRVLQLCVRDWNISLDKVLHILGLILWALCTSWPRTHGVHRNGPSIPRNDLAWSVCDRAEWGTILSTSKAPAAIIEVREQLPVNMQNTVMDT